VNEPARVSKRHTKRPKTRFYLHSKWFFATQLFIVTDESRIMSKFQHQQQQQQPITGSKRQLEKLSSSSSSSSAADGNVKQKRHGNSSSNEENSKSLPFSNNHGFVPPSVALSVLDKARQLVLSQDQLACCGADVR
jgi:hypothetical protein